MRRNADKIVLKKVPPGTELAGAYNDLSIWGDVMAKVDGPTDHTLKYAPAEEFDPEIVARRFIVFPSNLPANPKLLGKRYDLKYGNKTFWEQDFYTREGVGYGWESRVIVGRFSPPETYWVIVPTFKDLGPGENAAVIRVLKEKGYRESRRYFLPASKWKKLLAMSWDDTQAGDDYQAANAADEIAGPHSWDQIPGVFQETKKGMIKFVVSRGPGHL
jgi:hypothetical protein